MKKIFSFAINILVALFITGGVVLASTTIGTNVETTGDLTVGNGTPGVTQDGEDAYIEGTLEVDGAVQFDGNLVVNGTASSTFAGDVYITKAFKVGNGTPTVALNPEAVYIEDTLEVDGAVRFDSTLTSAGLVSLATASTTGVITVGDASTDNLVLNSRVSTVTTAGSATDIAASYLYGEAMELRYTVSAWPTGQSAFQGILMKLRTNVGDSAKGQRGMEMESSASNVSMNNLEGGYFYAYQRGGTARTVGSMYGVTAELMFDDDSDVTFSTVATATAAAAAFRGIVKTDNTMISAEAKLQGIDLVFGTTDGAAGTLFSGINLRDDYDTSGVVTLRYGLKMNDLAAAISVADIVLSSGDTIRNTGASTTLISGKLGLATSTASSALSIGSGSSSTIDISKGCFQGNATNGNRYHFWIKNDGNIGTGTGNCP